MSEPNAVEGQPIRRQAPGDDYMQDYVSREGPGGMVAPPSVRGEPLPDDYGPYFPTEFREEAPDPSQGLQPMEPLRIGDEPEPMAPLEPLAEAITKYAGIPAPTVRGPAMSVVEPTASQPVVVGEPTASTMPRITMPSGPQAAQTCPKGLAGMCVMCNFFPCGYMAMRCLRALMMDIAAGAPR